MVDIIYVVAFFLSFFIVFFLIPPLRSLAFKIDFLDKPVMNNERKIHRDPIPLTAGIAIFIGFFVTYLIAVDHHNDYQLFSILIGGTLILSIGIIDDWMKTKGREFHALPKLIVQVIAAILIYSSGIIFKGFMNPFTDQYIVLPIILQFVFTILWIFGVTTVINFSDGMDGLAGMLVTISATTLFIVAIAMNQTSSALMAIILIGVAIAYLKYNKPPAKIFMGDAGASFLGFMLAIIALDGAFKQATLLSILVPVLALGVPIFDNIFVVIKRFLAGKPVYKADATQAHYRLLASGLNQKQVVAFLSLLNLCFGLTAIIIILISV
ncbi:MraY family glycosyltransferase [Chengkuizengella axinellae]|uniref:MraY family glycosyltransferase n=1 Tax=Chengkuizengella axinellae TaxID=3064388 RepID=A0ABT9J582_9BACL|nr:MraY family glycosyltransferase [Chengkuizengella sp. 2205SS18-9]MDP5276757.1 MraY family glycosyltransferase [Chengkuizengella sp. 2205SS18-9]